MFDFDDDDFGMDDLIEADIEFGLIEDDQLPEKRFKKPIKKQVKKLSKKKTKSFCDIFKI
jgi:hypothetical protein